MKKFNQSIKKSNIFRVLFNKGYLSKDWDVFTCFQKTSIFEPSSELHPMDPCGTKKYTEDDENGDTATAIGNFYFIF